jgi:predicted 3-demethylubiquinone-9 3-methyltransferase (glyoxalase superfamily)
VVDFTLMGQSFMAISAGPLDSFNHAISFLVKCDSQAELDRYWDALRADGSVEECGWLKDKYGVSWTRRQATSTAIALAFDGSRA